MPLLSRSAHLSTLHRLLEQFPVVALIGPRQAGKTTLARQLAQAEASHFLDLEDPRDAARLAAPMLALESLTGLVVLDEVQTLPQIFPALRALADRPGRPGFCCSAAPRRTWRGNRPRPWQAGWSITS